MTERAHERARQRARGACAQREGTPRLQGLLELFPPASLPHPLPLLLQEGRLHRGATMEVKQEFQNLLEKLWMKLQGLGQASPLELGAFVILVLFFGEFGWKT